MKLFSWHMLPWRPWMDLREMRRYLSILLNICHNWLLVEFFSYRHFGLSFLAEPSRKQVWFTWPKVTSPKLLVLWGRVDWIQERYILLSLSDFTVCLPYWDQEWTEVVFLTIYSSSPNGLWVNSPWGRRLNRLLTQRPWGWEE